MKLINNTKKRNATANEIAKAILIHKLETVFYYNDNSSYSENYSEEFNEEIIRHLEKHVDAIVKKLNPNNDNIEIYF